MDYYTELARKKNAPLNISKIRENHLLTLRKQQRDSKQNQQRSKILEKIQLLNDPKIEINISTLTEIDKKLLTNFNEKTTLQDKIQIIMFFLEILPNQVSNEHLQSVKFCARQLRNVIQMFTEKITEIIERIFTENYIDNIIRILGIYSSFGDIAYELTYTLKFLSGHSTLMTKFICTKSNFPVLAESLKIENFSVSNNLLLMFSNCLAEPENLLPVLTNTNLEGFLVQALFVQSEGVSPEYIASLVAVLNCLVSEKTFAILKSDLASVTKIIVKYTTSNLCSDLFDASISYLKNYLAQLDSFEDGMKEKEDEFVKLAIYERLVKYISPNTDVSLILSIFNIYTSLTFLSNEIIYNMKKDTALISTIENYLSNVIGNCQFDDSINDIAYHIASFLRNCVSVSAMNEFLVIETGIFSKMLELFNYPTLSINAHRELCEVVRIVACESKSQKVLMELTCLDVVQKMLKSQIESQDPNSYLCILQIIETLLQFGDSLNLNENLLLKSFISSGVGPVIEKWTLSAAPNVSAYASNILDKYFKNYNV